MGVNPHRTDALQSIRCMPYTRALAVGASTARFAPSIMTPTVRPVHGPSAMLNYRAHRGGSKPPPYGWARGLPSKAFVQPICSPCGTRTRVGGIRQRQSFFDRGSASVPAQNNHGSAVGRGLAPAEACQSNQTPNVGAHTHGYPAPTESTFPANTRCRVTPCGYPPYSSHNVYKGGSQNYSYDRR